MQRWNTASLCHLVISAADGEREPVRSTMVPNTAAEKFLPTEARAACCNA